MMTIRRRLERIYDGATGWAMRQAEAPGLDLITKWSMIIAGILAAAEVVAQVWMRIR